MRCIEVAFKMDERIGAQSIAFGLIRGEDSTPLIIEISYCYVASTVRACGGHWTKELDWNEERVWPQDSIVEDILTKIEL